MTMEFAVDVTVTVMGGTTIVSVTVIVTVEAPSWYGKALAWSCDAAALVCPERQD